MTLATSAPAILTPVQIAHQAQSLTSPAQQKRFINSSFRAQSNKKGLPDFNNDFCVTNRAISRVGRYYRGVGKPFDPVSYANDLAMHIRAVIQDSWVKF